MCVFACARENLTVSRDDHFYAITTVNELKQSLATANESKISRNWVIKTELTAVGDGGRWRGEGRGRE